MEKEKDWTCDLISKPNHGARYCAEEQTMFAAMHESLVGTFETSRDVRCLIANGRKADVARTVQFGRE
jgi:hypothetical protein